MAVDGNEQVLAIGGPRGARGTEFIAAVGKVAVRDLPGRATFRVDDKNLHVAGLQIACAIESVDQTIVDGGMISPLCAGRRGGESVDMRSFARDESRRGETFSFRGPGDGLGG